MRAPQRDTVEFASAFLLGMGLGYSVTLLVAPDRSPTARFRRRMRAPRRRLRARAGDAREATRDTASRTGRLARELGGFGTELVRAAREELVDEGLRRLGISPDRGRRGRAPRGLRGLAARLSSGGDG